MRTYSLLEGQELVAAARSSIELYLLNPGFDKGLVKASLKRFDQKQGVFVSIEHYPTETPRGCMGFSSPVSYLRNDLVEAALTAAFEDSRFIPVSKPELEHMVVEVSVLSDPVELSGAAASRKKEVKVGRDGLIVRYGVHNGLLLPIIAMREGWTTERFLEEVCLKAGLPRSYWTQPNVRIFRFESQVFKEESPKGKISEVIRV
jgi:uncharacterized protein